MPRFHFRLVVEAADEGVGRDIHGPLDIAVAPQRKIGQPAISRRHPKLHRDAGGGHRQIESMLELDLLRLRKPKPSGDVGKRLLMKHDGAWSYSPIYVG